MTFQITRICLMLQSALLFLNQLNLMFVFHKCVFIIELIFTILGTDEHCTKPALERVNIAMYDIIRIHITYSGADM